VEPVGNLLQLGVGEHPPDAEHLLEPVEPGAQLGELVGDAALRGLMLGGDGVAAGEDHIDRLRLPAQRLCEADEGAGGVPVPACVLDLGEHRQGGGATCGVDHLRGGHPQLLPAGDDELREPFPCVLVCCGRSWGHPLTMAETSCNV